MNWVYADPTNRPYSNISKMIVVDDTLYISLSIAAAILNISTKKIRKYIRERENMNYFSDLSEDEKQRILSLNPQICQIPRFPAGRPVQVGDTIYLTIVGCAKAYNITPKSVRKRINSSSLKFHDWFWYEGEV